MGTVPPMGNPDATEANVSSLPGPNTIGLNASSARRPLTIEKYFENFLWGTRWIVLVAVLASLAIAFGLIYIATIDTFLHLKNLGKYASETSTAAPNPRQEESHVLLTPGEQSASRQDSPSRRRTTDHDKLRADTVSHVVEAIDGYLLGIVMLIFAFGLYELFISRIDKAEKDARASRILVIHSLDDLKHRLAQVILLILIVKFFESTLVFEFGRSIELLYLSIGILMVATALYLAHVKSHSEVQNPKSSVHDH